MKGPVEKKIEPFFRVVERVSNISSEISFENFWLSKGAKIRTFIPYSVCAMFALKLKKAKFKKGHNKLPLFSWKKISLKKICSWLEAVLCPQSSQEKKLKEKEKINFFSKMRECDIVVGTLLFFSQKKISCNKWPKNTTSKEREKKSQKKNWFYQLENFPKNHNTQKRMNLSVKSAFHCAYNFLIDKMKITLRTQFLVM